MLRFGRTAVVVGGLAVAAIVAGACTSESSSSAPRDLPVRRTAPSTTTTVPLPTGKLDRIVSLVPSATESLFAMGAGEAVVAVDSASNYPPEAPVTDLDAADPDVEVIASYSPQLVIADAGNQPVLDALNKAGFATLPIAPPRNFDGVVNQIEQIGAATGNIAAAARLGDELTNDALQLVSSMPKRSRLKYYFELNTDRQSVTSASMIGAMFTQLGMRNIVDRLDLDDDETHPKLDDAFIIQTNPDVIILADATCCMQTESEIASRPGWNGIRAVQEGNVIELDTDVATRWGPRTIDMFRQIVEVVRQVEPAPDSETDEELDE
jgi:iron complex transport system substrate-binding protein